MIVTILVFLLVLSLLVVVHEAGHFFMAKWSGVRVDEFGFGFPPKLFGKKWRGTEYTINAIPLGGFVKIKGVAGDDKELEKAKGDQDSFSSIAFWRKFLILFAGILMNMALAIVLFFVVFLAGTDADPSQLGNGAITSNQRIVITNVLQDSPAAAAGILPGDELIAVDGTELDVAAQTTEYTGEAGKEVLVEFYSRAEDQVFERSVQVETIQFQEREITGIGIGLQDIVHARYSVFRAAEMAVRTTTWTTYQIGVSLVDTAKRLFVSGQVSDDIAGPVGIAVITGEVARIGIVQLLQFTALLSINLALFNFLPIPALDGGRLFFVVVEKLRGKPVNQHLEAAVHNTGFLLLLLLVLLITLRDIGRFV